MNERQDSTTGGPPGAAARPALRRPEFIYSLALFVAALAALSVAIADQGLLPPDAGPGLVAFFLVYALFTIFMGYTHPRVGYVSFDRIAQVAAILVLGPVAAAWINGTASLLYPWQRLRRGRPFIEVLTAALHNAGLMSLMILVCGLLYQKLGGPVPLLALGWRDVATLLLLLLSMQALNDLGMRVLMTLEERRVPTDFSPFAFVVESGAGLGGILVALIINRMELSAVVLLLLVMTLGMFSLMQLAHIRTRLEALVAERTRKLQQKSLELERMASHDPLTGLHNRRHADQYLEDRINEFERYGRDFAIALVDLDDFKRINDDHSHDTGDEVLRLVAQLLRERCRDTDLVSRYGGEEFLLCFPQAGMVAAREACEKIRETVASTEWELLVPGVRVTLSAGVATMREGVSRRELLGLADRALYEAKSGGRNQVRVAAERMRAL
ncbi:MAG TPA: GGDEF domain-containing protein [Gammaproteobacteria bacterium]|nr:GGDEF domain-containing protein [Gammaproteobacteria bacterium]HRP86285.1 GGDEF domain-containing protein [Gammaproteobacteria bacterium]